MTKILVTALILCATAAGLFAFFGARPSEIPHYTADELSELTCEALGERHEEVIFAYHDAEIAHYKKTGAFHDDLGLPSEDVVPIPVLMKRFMRDNNISAADIAAGPSSTPIQNTRFYSEISGLCAANPSWLAVDAMRHAAINLGLMDGATSP